jgi:hypothetical protein
MSKFPLHNVHHWQGAISNIVLILCSKHFACNVQLARRRTDDGAAVGTLWTILPSVSLSLPAISFSLGPLRSTWLESDLRQTSTLSKPSPSDHRYYTNFFCARIQVLVPQWDKCLYYDGDNVEVWCVPSATQVPYLHQGHNNVTGFRVFVAWFQASGAV